MTDAFRQDYVDCGSTLIVPAGTDQGYGVSRNGLILPARFVNRPTGIDLFAGCGGFSLGFISAGYEVVAALDNDPTAAMSYMYNLGSYPCKFHFIEPTDELRMEEVLQKSMGFKGRGKNRISRAYQSGQGWIKHHPEATPVGQFFLGDVRKITGCEILESVGMERGEIDCVYGGPPCQGFTTAGKRDVMDPRNSLVFEFARLVCEILPKTMVFENVPGILNMTTPEGTPVVDALCHVLAEGGFGAYEGIKHALTTNPGAKAAFRGTKPKTKKAHRGKPKPKTQPSLFEGATV